MLRVLCAAALAALLAACAATGASPRGERAPIDHVVVLFMENRSFDHLFGIYPGADGLANYKGKQTDKNGVAYATLPQPLNTLFSPAVADPRFPADLPVEPFDTIKYVGANQQTGDLAVW